MNCITCSKYFSGIVPYNQHIESEKHKKKVATLGYFNTANTEQSGKIENKPASVFNPFSCSVCNISFDSFLHYQSHTLTLEHVENVSKNLHGGSDSSLNVGTVSSSTLNTTMINSSNEKSAQPEDETDCILPPMQHFDTARLASFAECKTCNKQFSGPEPYKQHLVSAVHKKKVDMENYLSNTTSQNSFNRFECGPCKKMFSGPVPLQQHMDSDVHRKRLKQLQLLEEFTGVKQFESPSAMECDLNKAKTGADKLKNTEVKYPWYCNTCLIQCTGLVSFKQHTDGENHLKKSRAAELLKQMATSQLKSGDDSVSQVPVSSNKEQTFAAPMLNIGIKNSLDIEANQILPEALINLSVISAEDINVKEFYPDVKIDFDKCSDEQNKNDINMKTDDDTFLKIEQSDDTTDANSFMIIEVDCSSDQQLEDDDKDLNMFESAVEFQVEDVYEECKLCNVKLKNKNEALSHFETYGHFMKKYRS